MHRYYFILCIREFIKEFWKIMECFLKKIDIWNPKFFINSIVYYFFFNFLVFLTSFFSILPVYGFQKNWKIFVLFYYMDLRFYQKFEVFEIPNFNKIPSFTISFLIFLYFWHFVFYFTYPNLSKNYRIFCGVLLEALEILLTISAKNSKGSFKQTIVMWNIYFSKFYGLLFVLLFFYYFSHFIFNFVYL